MCNRHSPFTRGRSSVLTVWLDLRKKNAEFERLSCWFASIYALSAVPHLSDNTYTLVVPLWPSEAPAGKSRFSLLVYFSLWNCGFPQAVFSKLGGKRQHYNMRPWCFEPVFASHSGAWVSWTYESWLVSKKSWFAVRRPMWTVVKSSLWLGRQGFSMYKRSLGTTAC